MKSSRKFDDEIFMMLSFKNTDKLNLVFGRVSWGYEIEFQFHAVLFANWSIM